MIQDYSYRPKNWTVVQDQDWCQWPLFLGYFFIPARGFAIIMCYYDVGMVLNIPWFHSELVSSAVSFRQCFCFVFVFLLFRFSQTQWDYMCKSNQFKGNKCGSTKKKHILISAKNRILSFRLDKYLIPLLPENMRWWIKALCWDC